jgi:cytochrome oxidase assembly protein ShyY1
VLRVLLTRRWILLTLLFVVLILIMGRLGLWQYHRYQQTKRSNHRISLAVHAKPVPMQALTHPGANLPGNERYRPVTATGHYDPAHQFVVRRRTNSDGSLGFFLVTPLITTDGDAVLVNRGWVAPAADAAAFPAVPKTPTGTVTLTGRLQLDETSRISGIRDVGGLPARQYMLINSGQQAKRLPEPVLSGYLELVKTSPSPAKGQTAEQIAAPGSDNQSDTDMAVVGQGVHLPYAIQWWLFVLMVPVGWWILLRQDLKERRKKAAAAVPAAAVATPAEPKIKAEQAVRTDAEVRAEPEVKDDSESKPEAGAATETGPAAGSDAGAATEAGSEAAARS